MTAVEGGAGRIGGRRIDGGHHHHHQRRSRHAETQVLRTQHQERLGKARERQHRRDRHQVPVRGWQQAPVAPLPARSRRRRYGGGFRLVHADDDQQHAQRRRHHGHPERALEVVGEPRHRPQRQQRTADGPHGVQRLPQPEAASAHFGRRDVGNEGIAWCATDAFAEPVRKARTDDPAKRRRQRERELRQRREPISGQHQRLAPAPAVRQRAGEELDDQRRGFGDALDDADHERARAEDGHHVQRQQCMHHLGGQIHAQADEAQYPDAAGNRRTPSIGSQRVDHRR